MTAEDHADAERRIQAVAAQQPPFAKLMGLDLIEVTATGWWPRWWSARN
jgi:hypothetical protein